MKKTLKILMDIALGILSTVLFACIIKVTEKITSEDQNLALIVGACTLSLYFGFKVAYHIFFKSNNLKH
jgi:hypothetical protein